MQVGAIIEKGPQDWQIVQQKDGFADLALEGKWVMLDEMNIEAKVFARIVREDTGDDAVSWTECSYPDDGRWNIVIKNVPAGGLYRIETCFGGTRHDLLRRGDMIHHIGIGDVYVIAGQSNASGRGRNPVYDPPEPGIHLLRNRGKWDMASHPLNESTDTICEINREKINPGHSPYLHFARMLKRELGYPIGLMTCALGGSPLCRWNPGEEGDLYENMVRTVKSHGGTVSGILWYQGCTDAMLGMHETYFDRFKHMVECVRKDLGDDKLPFLTVQLNRAVIPSSESLDKAWGTVREAQRRAAKLIPDVHIVPSVDCMLSDDIHNSSASNMVIGERVAKVALTEIYGGKYLCKAPELRMAKMEDDDRVTLIFDNVTGGLHTHYVGAGDLPFTFKDEAGSPGVKGYEIPERNIILLTLERKLRGSAFVHGAFEMNPETPVPVDEISRLPMLSFYGVEVTRNG